MRLGRILACALALLSTTIFVSSVVTGNNPGGLDSFPPGAFVPGSSPKTHVVEVFTGAWCPPCANADPALSRLADEWGPDLVTLEWHCCQNTNPAGSNYDPYYDPGVYGVRKAFYVPGSYGIPTVIFDGGGLYPDGTLIVVGSGPSASAYDAYRDALTMRTDPTSNMVVSIDGDLQPTRASATVTVTATDPVVELNLYVRTVLYEESLYYMGTNGQPYHRYTARSLDEQPITISQGETKTVTATFAVGGTWNLNKLGVAALVQSQDRRTVSDSGYQFTISDIVNAARLDFVPRGLLLQHDRGNSADYTETVEKLLAQRGVHFDTWNSYTPGMDTGTTDVQGLPGATRLAEVPLIYWETGSATMGTLTASEQTVLQNQLANGNGALLLSGENIGAEIGASQFYNDVLKAQFLGDNEPATSVRGVPSDPISGPWATGALSILGSSPDAVDLANGGNGAISFVYNPTGAGAGVRSDYDTDSRVLYLAFDYFRGTDPNRADVFMSATNWFDNQQGPVVTAMSPNGGEVLTPGTPYKITWSARDVRIPANGVDLYYAADSSNPTWNSIAGFQPNDGVYWWNPPFGVDSSTCRLKVVVRDAAGNSAEDISDADFTIGAPGTPPFTMILQPGRNLVSFSYVTQSTSLSAVLASLDPWYAWVRVYDARNPSDPWVTYYRGGPASELARLDNTMGFWIYITAGAPVTLTITGGRPVMTSISLVAGWNLVGFPSGRTDVTVASVRAATGATVISTFDGGSPTWLRVMADTDLLSEGSAYWIYVPSPVTWVVPYS